MAEGGLTIIRQQCANNKQQWDEKMLQEAVYMEFFPRGAQGYWL